MTQIVQIITDKITKLIFNEMVQNNYYIIPFTEEGNQQSGRGSIELNLFFDQSNLIEEYTIASINDTDHDTSDEIITRHIEKYYNVWKALA